MCIYIYIYYNDIMACNEHKHKHINIKSTSQTHILADVCGHRGAHAEARISLVTFCDLLRITSPRFKRRCFQGIHDKGKFLITKRNPLLKQ